ncbi:MAG: hypothetical protein ACYTE1_03485, partial [Planctomycetota bacterium]
VMIFLASMTGCGSDYRYEKENMEVVVFGQKTFPEELAGPWVSDDATWGITLAKNGAIESIIHPMGYSRILPGLENSYPLVEDGEASITPGLWVVHYTPESRELVIEIVFDHFIWIKGDDEVKGNSRDILYGIVSEDFKKWTLNWDNFSEFYVTTDMVEDYELPMSERLIPRGTFVFEHRSDQ